MNNPKRTIIGALDYSIITMQELKKDLQDIGAPNHDYTWATASVIVILLSNLIKISKQEFDREVNNALVDSNEMLREIQYEFNQFINGVINHG